MKKIAGIVILIVSAIAGVSFFFYSRRWQAFTDNYFVGNQDFNFVAFVTDYDTKLKPGDSIEIKQTDVRGVTEPDAYNGTAKITGTKPIDGGKFIFITDKSWQGSTPKIGGQWRKLNLI